MVWICLDSCSVSTVSRDPPAVLGRIVFLMTNVQDRSIIVDFFGRWDADAGVGGTVTSSLAASFLAEGIAHLGVGV